MKRENSELPPLRTDPSQAPDETPEALTVFLYNFFLTRNPEPDAFQTYVKLLRDGHPFSDLCRRFAGSEEFIAKARTNPNFSTLLSALGIKAQSSIDPSLLQNTFHEMAWKAEDRPKIVDYPVALFNIELTNRCPFKCVMCPRTNHMTRDQGLMEFALFKKVIDELITTNPAYKSRNNLVWLHHFGESLTHPEIGKLMKYATGRGVPVSISINPLLLSNKVADELIGANPVAILVSLDGHDDASFEKIRGVKNAYEKSKEHLQAFLQKKVSSQSAIEVTLSVIDFPMNEMSAAAQREKWRSEWLSVPGIDAFEWKPFTSWNGDAPEINDLNRGKPSREYESARKNLFKVTCGWPWAKVNVTWDGDVVPCCYDYDKKYVLGNVSTQSLAEIWNSPRMIALRSEFASNRVTNSLCAHCEYLYE